MKSFWLFGLLPAVTWAMHSTPLVGKNLANTQVLRVEAAPQSKGLVLLFLSARCPCSQSHEALLKTLAEEFTDFTFAAVHSNADESEAMARAHFTVSKLPFPILQDEGAKIANDFKALKTPHAFVLDRQGEIVYQGGVSDSANVNRAKRIFLREVLTALRKGESPPLREGRSLGCYIRR